MGILDSNRAGGIPNYSREGGILDSNRAGGIPNYSREGGYYILIEREGYMITVEKGDTVF